MRTTTGMLILATAIAVSASVRAPVALGEDVPPATSSSSQSRPLERKLPTTDWEVLFEESEGMTALEYARQLDYFGIELAAVAKNGQIQYASHLSERKPERRIGRREDEPRMSISWKRGTLAALEAKLMAKAGIATKDKVLTHFYPQALEARLVALERNYAGRDSQDIQRTRFKIRPQTNQPKAYEFYVDEQDARSPGSGSSGQSSSPSGVAK